MADFDNKMNQTTVVDPTSDCLAISSAHGHRNIIMANQTLSSRPLESMNKEIIRSKKRRGSVSPNNVKSLNRLVNLDIYKAISPRIMDKHAQTISVRQKP